MPSIPNASGHVHDIYSTTWRKREQLPLSLQSFQALFSRPQYEHFITVLMSLLLSLEGYTLSHLKHTIASIKSLASLSRFFAKARLLSPVNNPVQLLPFLQNDATKNRIISK